MSGNTFLYFGYGSNMLTERLTARCPSARPVGPVCAPGYEMSFNVQSEDGSSKAGLVAKTGALAWGVLYEILLSEQPILDHFEHVPVLYTREEIFVAEGPNDETFAAVTYIPRPEHLTTDMVPYDWYKALCHGGAQQHRLPAEAIQRIADVPSMGAPYAKDFAHNGLKVAIDALSAAGFAKADGTLLI